MRKNKIYWASHHDLYPEQIDAINSVHGKLDIIHERVVFRDPLGLSTYIDNRQDGYVYAVAGGIHYLFAQQEGREFFIFETHPDKIAFRSIFKVSEGTITKVWGARENEEAFSVKT